VAFNAGNLLPVAKGLREKRPDLQIVICADDDYLTPGNPGITKAREAAEAIGAKLAIPAFGANRPEKFTDFNDLAPHFGLDRVRECLQGAPRAETKEAWPEPKPLPSGLLPVEAFDEKLLPDTIAPWVMDISERMQCPPEFVAVSAMVALGSVI